MMQSVIERRPRGADQLSATTVLVARVDRLADEVATLSEDALRHAVAELGRIAAIEGDAVVAALAASMRANLADARGRAVAALYLRAMRDAIAANSRDVAAAASWVASVNVRLTG